MRSIRPAHLGRKLLATALCLLVVFAASVAVDIYAFSFTTDRSPADAAVVLGAAASNGQPSPVFEERIRHAIAMYQTGQVRFLIFTGGRGDNEPMAESIVAANDALRNGVPAKDMYCEVTSHITLENLQGAKDIIQARGLGRVLIVSDPLHMRRSVAMARDLGLNAYSSPTPTTRYVGFQAKLLFLLREVYFFGSYLFERPFILRFGIGREMMTQPCT